MNRLLRLAEKSTGFFDKETEHALIALAQTESGRDSMKARNLLVSRNIGIAKSAAKTITHQDDFDDAVSAGAAGIIAAIDGFDVTKGGRLSTIATIMARQHVRRYVASTGRPIRLPEYVHTQMNKMKRAWAILNKRAMNVPPTDAAIDEYNNWPEGTTKALRGHYSTSTVSVNTPLSNDERVTLGDTIAGKDYNPDDISDSLGEEQTIAALLGVLNPRSREVVDLHFGIGEHEVHTLVQIADKLGVSKQRAHQILTAALKEMAVRNGRL